MTQTKTALLIVDSHGRAAQPGLGGAPMQTLAGRPIFSLLGIQDDVTCARLKRAIAAAVATGEASVLTVIAGGKGRRLLTVRPAREAGYAVVGLGDPQTAPSDTGQGISDIRP